MSWFTDRKVGETAVLPGGVRIRIVAVRGCKVRLEYLNPPRAEPKTDVPNGTTSEGRAER